MVTYLSRNRRNENPRDTNICPPRLLASIANAAADPGCFGSRYTMRSLQTVHRPALRRRSSVSEP